MRKSKDRQHNAPPPPQKKRAKDQTTIYKSVNTKLKLEQHEPHKQLRVNSCAPRA